MDLVLLQIILFFKAMLLIGQKMYNEMKLEDELKEQRKEMKKWC